MNVVILLIIFVAVFAIVQAFKANGGGRPGGYKGAGRNHSGDGFYASGIDNTPDLNSRYGGDDHDKQGHHHQGHHDHHSHHGHHHDGGSFGGGHHGDHSGGGDFGGGGDSGGSDGGGGGGGD